MNSKWSKAVICNRLENTGSSYEPYSERNYYFFAWFLKMYLLPFTDLVCRWCSEDCCRRCCSEYCCWWRKYSNKSGAGRVFPNGNSYRDCKWCAIFVFIAKLVHVIRILHNIGHTEISLVARHDLHFLKSEALKSKGPAPFGLRF